VRPLLLQHDGRSPICAEYVAWRYNRCKTTAHCAGMAQKQDLEIAETIKCMPRKARSRDRRDDKMHAKKKCKKSASSPLWILICRVGSMEAHSPSQDPDTSTIRSPLSGHWKCTVCIGLISSAICDASAGSEHNSQIAFTLLGCRPTTHAAARLMWLPLGIDTRDPLQPRHHA